METQETDNEPIKEKPIIDETEAIPRAENLLLRSKNYSLQVSISELGLRQWIWSVTYSESDQTVSSY